MKQKIIYNLNQFLITARCVIKTDGAIALAIAVSWQAILLILGIAIENSNSDSSLLSHTMRWDAHYYTNIIEGSYSSNDASPVFYPLFPVSVMAVHYLSFTLLDIPTAGFMVNTIALWASILLLIKISKLIPGIHSPHFLIILFLSFPAAFFMHVFYSEALFCALAFWSYYLALQRKWLPMVLVLGILTAARLPAILFVALGFFEFCRAYRWRIKDICNRNIFLFLITPVGFIVYGLYLNFVRNDFLAMFHNYDLWSFHVFDPNIIKTYYDSTAMAINGLIGTKTPYSLLEIIVNFAIPVMSLAILLLCSLVAIFKIKKWAVPLGTTGILSFVMFTLNSNVNSVHRYILPCLVIYLSLAYLAQRNTIAKIGALGVAIIGILIQSLLYALFISNNFAG